MDLHNRISAIIEISGIPLAAIEFERGIHHVFVTSGLSELLGLSGKEAAELYHNSSLFDQYIRSITKKPVKGEEEIYQIGEARCRRPISPGILQHHEIHARKSFPVRETFRG